MFSKGIPTYGFWVEKVYKPISVVKINTITPKLDQILTIDAFFGVLEVSSVNDGDFGGVGAGSSNQSQFSWSNVSAPTTDCVENIRKKSLQIKRGRFLLPGDCRSSMSPAAAAEAERPLSALA